MGGGVPEDSLPPRELLPNPLAPKSLLRSLNGGVATLLPLENAAELGKEKPWEGEKAKEGQKRIQSHGSVICFFQQAASKALSEVAVRCG